MAVTAGAYAGGMKSTNSFERGAAASAALLITLGVLWGFASLEYRAPVHAAASQCLPASRS